MRLWLQTLKVQLLAAKDVKIGSGAALKMAAPAPQHYFQSSIDIFGGLVLGSRKDLLCTALCNVKIESHPAEYTNFHNF